ncbi:DNA-3-methyladenine glycosylase [Actinomycetospora sp. TBRC 11914]|uniref:DNA-3-methyladenine glycosylase family protein n=1 Tax=Actinomycetospora sp. TBRC 11914 TaxID=2729387 RepID=UPI00145EDA37|nr:DNA-3-methyladenine glycosylase 2 family protein [Actinomycetospora sp. TBRC 11914]NMO91335.1 DNA-3-methyladenine glycosylase 2 family protein [Actinomycetospora sp. TBRC 11914]
MTLSEPHRVAAAELAAREPTIARLAERYGLPTFVHPTGTDFAFVAGAITHQQLSNRSADAILGRLRDALGGEITACGVLSLSDDELRRVGMSAAKVRSLRDLAVKVDDGTVVLDGAALATRDDAAVVAELTTVRGVGRWTAEMFLMLQLLRLDVWPTGDLSVRKGYAAGWGVPVPSARELDGLGEVFRPHRTVAAWYCWAVLGQAPGP